MNRNDDAGAELESASQLGYAGRAGIRGRRHRSGFCARPQPCFFRPRATPTVSQAASATPSDPAQDATDRNGEFLLRLSAEGPQLRRSKDAAINDARRVCARFAGGEREQEIVQDMLQGSPGMSLDTASSFTDTAIRVFCPDGVVDNS
ncbi:DUF732 domain-containing protein [Candidatus Mycobacterium methanotrophicum]|uniref:DUF732 domain-containing protein n=1 Tax=Candidatus Mycobacterium methanotrophicum TaxID=2943498 RepID=A0ABY4QJP5_9MYCO|nr:DUF732 domain-containing protein [Candidatus Mycobacterium methanotrophicum]UQX10759.1 DUF732 domain-containing protein [Candidatus Mycobacterium methanotrophicum]